MLKQLAAQGTQRGGSDPVSGGQILTAENNAYDDIASMVESMSGVEGDTEKMDSFARLAETRYDIAPARVRQALDKNHGGDFRGFLGEKTGYRVGIPSPSKLVELGKGDEAAMSGVLMGKEGRYDPEKNPLVKLARQTAKLNPMAGTVNAAYAAGAMNLRSTPEARAGYFSESKYDKAQFSLTAGAGVIGRLQSRGESFKGSFGNGLRAYLASPEYQSDKESFMDELRIKDGYTKETGTDVKSRIEKWEKDVVEKRDNYDVRISKAINFGAAHIANFLQPSTSGFGDKMQQFTQDDSADQISTSIGVELQPKFRAAMRDYTRMIVDEDFMPGAALMTTQQKMIHSGMVDEDTSFGKLADPLKHYPRIREVHEGDAPQWLKDMSVTFADTSTFIVDRIGGKVRVQMYVDGYEGAILLDEAFALRMQAEMANHPISPISMMKDKPKVAKAALGPPAPYKKDFAGKKKEGHLKDAGESGGEKLKKLLGGNRGHVVLDEAGARSILVPPKPLELGPGADSVFLGDKLKGKR